MASMSEADFVRISVMLTTIATRLQISAYTAYISHYFETLADEVGLIWPERWMLGKVLFLLTRYSVFLRIIFELFGSFPSELPLSVETCAALSLVAYAMSTIVTYSAIGSILLCMYALLGARRKWLPLCLFPFFGSLIVNVVGVTLDFRSSTPFSDPNLPSTYKCNFSASDRRWWTMSAYNILARDIWMLLLGGLTIYLRYRSQKNSLLTVIKRDGAVFYLGACCLNICYFSDLHICGHLVCAGGDSPRRLLGNHSYWAGSAAHPCHPIAFEHEEDCVEEPHCRR